MRFDPFHRTVEPLTNPVPLTVSVNAAPPAMDEAGLRPVVAGTGLLIKKVWVLDVPPPGAGVNTVTWAVPAVAMSAADMAAVSWVEDTNVVVRLDPFHWTTEPLTKPVPLTVSVKSDVPAIEDAGARLLIVGIGAPDEPIR